jgi:hypothetical protein
MFKEELPSKCKACEGTVAPLVKDRIEKLLAEYSGWQLKQKNKAIIPH